MILLAMALKKKELLEILKYCQTQIRARQTHTPHKYIYRLSLVPHLDFYEFFCNDHLIFGKLKLSEVKHVFVLDQIPAITRNNSPEIPKFSLQAQLNTIMKINQKQHADFLVYDRKWL